MKPEARVLVVDDDPTIRDFVGLVLEDEGYEVLTAEHGAIALDIAARCPPSVILLDVQMPVMDGRSFAAAYRSTAASPAPIVVMTAASRVAAWADDIAADGYLPKPFDLSLLLETVETHARSST